MNQAIITAIRNRRSIRDYTSQEVSRQQLHEILVAGSWAPSGLNNQPWRFVTIVAPELKNRLAELTHYNHIVKAAPALIAVFLDRNAMYDSVKDHQAAGACIQNMLLAVEALDLGAVWLGQILKNKEKVNMLLEISKDYELMAVLAIGHPAHHTQASRRKDMSELLLKEL